MRCRTLILLLSVSMCARLASAQISGLSATTVPTDQLIQPSDLSKLLGETKSVDGPFVIQVGSRVFFDQAHIIGSVYAGPGSQPAGLALLEKTVVPLPRNKFIVIYCGCCPWNRCPNVGPAWRHLHDLGFTNVKVVYFANNFGDDWVSKGYPTEK